MSEKISRGKLGRNPLDGQSETPRMLPPQEIPPAKETLVSKFLELGLEIDFEEFIQATIGTKIQRFTRFFHR